MKIYVIFIIIAFTNVTAFAQNQIAPGPIVSTDNDIVYRLFSTRNTFTFIKLNTRNGQMLQVQWDTGKERFETPLSLVKRTSTEEEKNGRFFLYPTTNIYTFILLDQFDGRTWQVQWSTKPEERLVLAID